MPTLTLYHGTSTAHLPEILEKGLWKPCLTSDEDIALYYAETAAEQDGGDPVILEVTVDTADLRVDRSALDEPVGFGDCTSDELEEIVEEAYDRWTEEHPEWVKNGLLYIPDDAYHCSLDTVASCRSAVDIPPEKIRVVDAA